jgi:hypothetical protein
MRTGFKLVRSGVWWTEWTLMGLREVWEGTVTFWRKPLHHRLCPVRNENALWNLRIWLSYITNEHSCWYPSIRIERSLWKPFQHACSMHDFHFCTIRFLHPSELWADRDLLGEGNSELPCSVGTHFESAPFGTWNTSNVHNSRYLHFCKNLTRLQYRNCYHPLNCKHTTRHYARHRLH